MNIKKIKKTENIREIVSSHNYFELFYMFNAYSVSGLAKLFGVSANTIRDIKKEYGLNPYNRMTQDWIIQDMSNELSKPLLEDIEQTLNDNYINSNVKERIKLKQELHIEKIRKARNKKKE